VGILTHEFVPRYSLEEFAPVLSARSTDVDLGVGIPMVCFCDMPLSQAARHKEAYGRYALGLTKAWGMAAGVAPVLYTYPSAATTDAFVKLHLEIEELRGTADDGAPFSYETERFLCFVKPYEGVRRREGRDPEQFRFYDEREWRYDPRGPWRALTRAEYGDPQAKNAANSAIADRLSFTPNDIRYIIVETDGEIPSMIDEVRRIKSPKYSKPDIDLVCSRIVSAAQIAADF
jgi:hypothetical protein